jgi:hypothetical protein
MNKLTLPIYLNQKYVFDLLAILEDGFSQVETIKTGQNNANSEKDALKGEVGVNNVFAFLKFGISADKVHDKVQQLSNEVSKEKIHTPNSLFSKMRSNLLDQKIVVTSDFLNCKPGDFIEIKLSLKKNPLIDILDSYRSLMKMGFNFQDKVENTNQGNKQKTVLDQKSELEKNLLKIDLFRNQLTEEGSIDLIGTATEIDNLQVVMTLDKAFIGEFSLPDITDGHFSVLGKVTNVISKSDEEGVNLLRKTGLNKLNKAFLENIFNSLSNIENIEIKNENIELFIKPPVIQIIPIAIFT